MKRNLFIVFVAIIILGILSISTRWPSDLEKTQAASSLNKKAILKTVPDPSGTINGANNPKMVSDQVAYTVLFRLLSSHRSDEERNRIKAYVRQIFGCKTCRTGKKSKDDEQVETARIDALASAAEEFRQRVGELDTQVEAITKANWPRYTSEVRARLAELQRQKEAIVNEIVFSLNNRLDSSGRAKLRKHIDDRVKRKIKIVPPHEHPTFD